MHFALQARILVYKLRYIIGCGLVHLDQCRAYDIVNCTRIRTQTPHPISYLLRLTHQTHFTRSVRPSLKQSEKSLISVNSQDHSISKRLLYGIFSVLPGIPHAHHRLNQTALNQRWFNAGPPSATLAQHRTSIEWTSRVCSFPPAPSHAQVLFFPPPFIRWFPESARKKPQFTQSLVAAFEACAVWSSTGNVHGLSWYNMVAYNTAVISQKAVSAYFSTEQILPFGFAEQYRREYLVF